MGQNFKDKVSWIVGASSGIGEEIAKQINADGGIVVLSARKVDKLNEVQKSLKFPEKSFIIQLDLEDQSNFEELTKQVIAKYDKIDYLFNNGGVSQRGEAVETQMQVDRRMMEINYFGNIALTKIVAPYMREANGGHIVVISSIAGKFGFYLRSAYSASKHALQGFYESFLLEEAKHNINVTLAYPGKINTPISESALNATGESHGVMDHNQETGMSAEDCVKKLLKAVLKRKKSILIGNRELWAVHIKRLSPALFWRIIKNQSAT